jgi:Glycosyltransferase WbsX/Glycosyl transferases group 1
MKRALIGSFAPPLFDRDSGSRRVMDLIELLIEDGWQVTFVAANGLRLPPYVRALEERGVHVVDGAGQRVDDMVLTGQFGLAILVSWPVAEFYLPLIRRLSPTTHVVVDSLDLQFMRDARRSLRAGSPGLLDDEFGRQLVAEVNAYVTADAVLTVSDKEAALLADLTGETSPAYVVPDIENIPARAVPARDRVGMVFVGSFRHAPNVQAVEYLCSEIVPHIDPELLAAHPIYIVGDGLDDSVRRYGEGLPSVRMVGWVPEVLPYLQRARISLVPLRYGAGTKRKMIQTLMAGTPCVSTHIGIEGLNVEIGEHVLIADEPTEFAEAVERLLTDSKLWARLARRGRRAIQGDHSREAVALRFRDALTDIGQRPPRQVVPDEVTRDVYESRLRYQDNQRIASRLRDRLADFVPDDATVLIASGGSEELLRLGSFASWHFPRAEDGSVAENPGNGTALRAATQALTAEGATHLLFPQHGRWWLEYYPEFDEFLRRDHTVVFDEESGILFALSGRQDNGALPRMVKVGAGTPPTRRASDESDAVKLIAFYLPQFHPIPENDRWWGDGFTEWTNVTKATPLFPGHLQPHQPADLGFYDLRLPEVREAQADLARAHGIHAFCYYEYWFDGTRLLERPFDDVLTSGRPDFPFCLCWANEPWSRRWDGREHDVLQQQTYSPEDDVDHLRSLVPAFSDDRYLTVDGKPLYIVYQARDLPDPAATVDRWRLEADRAGLPGLYLMAVETGWDAGWDATAVGFDAKVLFQPQFSMLSKTPRLAVSDLEGLSVYDYQQAWPILAEPPDVPYLRYETVFPSWDNSSRRGSDAVVVHDATAEAYEQFLRTAIGRAIRRDAPEPLVFVNAWNEWGEGCHLEPDLAHGHGYLEATRRALDAFHRQVPNELVVARLPQLEGARR